MSTASVKREKGRRDKDWIAGAFSRERSELDETISGHVCSKKSVIKRLLSQENRTKSAKIVLFKHKRLLT